MKALKTFFEFTLVVMCMLCMAGCQNDEYAEPETEEVNEPGLYLRLNTLGNGSGSGTRTIVDDESKINTLSAVYFKGTKLGADELFKFVEADPVTLSTPLDVTSSKTIKLNPTVAGVTDRAATGEAWKVVFIANSTMPTLSNTTTLKEFKETLMKATIATTGLYWSSDNAYIPMYCCTGEVDLPNKPYYTKHYINETDNTSSTQTFSLLRAMAKFTITYTAPSSTEFTADPDLYNYKITDLSVVNGYVDGLVCINYTTPPWDSSNKRVTVPTTQTTPTITSTAPTLSNANGLPAAVTFYMFEREVTDSDVKNKSNCYIKLKGTRTNSAGGESMSNVEYMLPIYDIVYNTVTEKYVLKSPVAAGPVLRNHYYTYAITGVHLYSLRATLSIVDWTPVNISVDPVPLR